MPVSVNGVAISSAAIARETQHHMTSDPDVAWELATRALAIRELLVQEAERLAIEAEPIDDGEGRTETAEEARLRALVDREVVVPRADEAACRATTKATAALPLARPVRGRHILLAAAPGDAEARAKSRLIAETLIAELQQRPQGFAARLPSSPTVPRRGTAAISARSDQARPSPSSSRHCAA